MKTFTDTAGRTWLIELNVSAVKRVRKLLDFDLLAVLDKDSQVLERLANDVVLLVDVLYVLLRDQADEAGVTDEQFGAGLGGDSLDQAATAFLEELVLFFRPPRRAALGRLLEKVRELEAKASTAAIERIDGGGPERLLARELAKVDQVLASMDSRL